MFRPIFIRRCFALLCFATVAVSHAIPSTVTVNYTLGSDETASGDLTIQSGTVNLNGYTLTVTGTLRQTGGTLTLNGGATQRGAPNLNIGGDFLVMTSGTRNADGTWSSVSASAGCIYSTNVGDWIRVGGEFVQAGGADGYLCGAQWTNGLLELKGNFTQLPGAGAVGSTFNSQGGHVVKLIGNATQAIRLSNPGSSKFTKLFVMANTDSNGLSRVSLPLGLNFPWTLYENTALGGPFVMGNVALNLNGYSLKVAGDLKHSTGTITLNGGTAARTSPNLDITGNYLVMTSGTRNTDGTWSSVAASGGCVYSTNVGDWIRVGGEFVEAGGADGYLCGAQWTNGLLELKGNFTQLPGAGAVGSTFNSQGGHVLKLVGNATQAIRMSNPNSSRLRNLLVGQGAAAVNFLHPCTINPCSSTYTTSVPWMYTGTYTNFSGATFGSASLQTNETGASRTANLNLVGNAITVTQAGYDGWKQIPAASVTATNLAHDSARNRLVIATHGWNSDTSVWANQLVGDVCQKLANAAGQPWNVSFTNVAADRANNTGVDEYCDFGNWRAMSYNWVRDAGQLLRPGAAVANARTIGEQFAKGYLTSNVEFIHLIAHSAGSNFVESFAKSARTIATANGWSQPKIHITLLDAFCPNPSNCDYGNAADWADQYVDNRFIGDIDLTASATSGWETNVTLRNAYNFDVTSLDRKSSYAGIGDQANYHAFPVREYVASNGGALPISIFDAVNVGPMGLGAPLAAWAQTNGIGNPSAVLSAQSTRFGRGQRCALNQADTAASVLSKCGAAIPAPPLIQGTAHSRAYRSSQCAGSSMSTAALSARTCAQLQQNLVGGGVKASGSPEPGMLLASVTTDNVADRLSFDYQFTDAASPGFLQVFVDNQLVFVADQTVVGSVLKNSGNVEIPRMQAGVHDFRVVVKALTLGDAGVDVRNIAFDRISSCPLSIAGDATATAAKDGLLLTRYLAGFRGDALVAGLTLGSGVTAQSIESAIGNGTQYDVFGRATPAAFATVDGLILVRLMLGVADSALFNGVSIPVDSQYTTAAEVRANVNGKCGASF